MRHAMLLAILLVSNWAWSAPAPSAAKKSAVFEKVSQSTSKNASVSQEVNDDDLNSLEQEGLKYSYLELPVYDSEAVMEWAKYIGLLAFNYDYKNYIKRFSHLSLYFTYNGWKRFLTFLWLSRDYSLEHMVASHLRVSAEMRADPIIWASMPEDGRFTWEVLLPLIVHYQGPGVKTHRAVNFVVRLSRVTTKVQKNGIAVIAVREIQPGIYPGTLE